MNIYIDSENVSSSEFQNIMNTYNQYQKSILSIKIYADWSNLKSKKWHECCKKNINVEQILESKLLSKLVSKYLYISKSPLYCFDIESFS